MIIRQQKSERVCESFHVSAYKTKVLIIICAAKLLYCHGFAKQGGVKNVKESDFLIFCINYNEFSANVCAIKASFFCPRVGKKTRGNKFNQQIGANAEIFGKFPHLRDKCTNFAIR